MLIEGLQIRQHTFAPKPLVECQFDHLDVDESEDYKVSPSSFRNCHLALHLLEVLVAALHRESAMS